MSSLPSPSQADPPNSGAWEQHKEMLRQHQSLTSLPTRSRADQPNSGVWEQHKKTLRQLYLVQSKPLKQVIKIMRQEHDFEATDKMYKYHFHRWKFRKNMTKNESRYYEADVVAGRAVVLPFIHGRELGSLRLRTRIQKTVAQRPMMINIPDVPRLAEISLFMVAEHSRARLKVWNLTEFHEEATETESWAAAACLAGYAISTTQGVGANFKVLRKAGQQLRLILEKQEPMFIWSTFTVIIQLLKVSPRLGMAFIGLAVEACASLPSNDPLRRLWAAILRMDPSVIPQLIAQLTSAQIEVLRKETEPKNRFVLNYVRTSAKYLHDRELITPHATHAQMDSIIQALSPSLYSSLDTSASDKNVLIAAYLFKACIHLDAQEYHEVEAILRKVDPDTYHVNGMSDPQMVNFYEIKAEMLLSRGDYHDSEKYYWKTLTTAQEKLSKTMPSRIGYCFVALGHFFEVTGNTEQVERVQALYDEHLQRMTGDASVPQPFETAASEFEELQLTQTRNVQGERYKLPPIDGMPVRGGSEGLVLAKPMDQVSHSLDYLGPGRHKVCVDVQWELSDFVSHGLDNIQDLRTVMTITGEPAESYVSSCEGYIKSTWNKSSSVVGFCQKFVASSLDYSSTAAVIKHPSSPKDSDRLTFQMTAAREHLVGLCQCILWLAAVCRPPQYGSVHASVATFEMVGMDHFQINTQPLTPLPLPEPTSPIGCCWLNMFDGGYVLAQGFPIPPRTHGRGIELPFDVMIEQAMTYHAISHTINDQDSIILKGSHTALVPVYFDGLSSFDETNEIQWHLIGTKPKLVPIDNSDGTKGSEHYHLTDLQFSGENPELSWEDIDRRGLKIFPLRDIQDIAQKRSFVGHFPKAHVVLGTDKEVYHDLRDGIKAEPVRGNVIKFGRAMSLTLGTNAATAGLLSMSASITIKRSKFDPVPKQGKALVGDKLRNDCNKPHILYDISKRIAWMVPEACLILYMIHYWASLQGDRGLFAQGTNRLSACNSQQESIGSGHSSSVKEFMPFIEASSNGGEDAALAILKAFQDPKKLPNQIRFFDEPSNSVSVVDIIRNMYLALDTIVEHQKRKKPGFFNRRGTHPDLWGYDLADVAGFSEAPVKRVRVDKEQCGGWYELTDPEYRIVVLFGNNFGELIKYEADQMICHQWGSVPPARDFLSADGGTLEYLRELDRRGRPSVFLSGQFSSTSAHRQEQCKKEDWPCCNMTLQLTSTEPEMVIKVGKGEAAVIGRVTDRGYRNAFGTLIGKRTIAADEASSQSRKVQKRDHTQGSLNAPCTCPSCSGDNQVEMASNRGMSSPQTERDVAAGSETSYTATPQTAFTPQTPFTPQSVFTPQSGYTGNT